MKTILYPTDFSKNSKNALKYACELRKLSGAELVMLHVSDIPTLWNSPDSHADSGQAIESSVIEHNTNRLKKFYQILSDDNKIEKNVRFVVKEDKRSYHGIIEMIAECNADLVIMGIKGESKIEELLMGSTSKEVIERARCPVLTIPAETVYRLPEQILYASTFENKDIDAIFALQRIAKLFNAEITIAHVITHAELVVEDEMKQFKNRLNESVTYEKIKFELLLSDNVDRCLNDYLSQNKIDLIVMLERENNSLFNKWFHGDLVEKMEFHTTIPLLSYNEKYLPLRS